MKEFNYDFGPWVATIYPKGDFFAPKTHHAISVGGCGIGYAKTLRGAKQCLRREILRRAQVQIGEAQRQQGKYRSLEARVRVFPLDSFQASRLKED